MSKREASKKRFCELDLNGYNHSIHIGDFIMEQNSFFWLVPQKNQPSLLLSRGSSANFDFIQCFDGRFSYEIWVYTQSAEDLYMGMTLDDQPVYHSMHLRCAPEKRWIQLGNFQATKGEHRISVTAVNKDCCLEGLLICRGAGYIHDGTATTHLPRIIAGEDILSILQQEGFLDTKRETPEQKEFRLKRLAKYGFLERLDQDASEGRCRCGVPMGGIGAGKIELDSEGVLTAITINNNCEVPIYKTPGSFFAAWASTEEQTDSFLLQTTNLGNIQAPLADKIDFDGKFPRARLTYKKANFPINISLSAFSPLVPYSEKNSALPNVFYTFTVTNPSDAPVDAAILFSFENLIGTGGSMANQSKNPDFDSTFVMNSWNPGNVWCDRRGNRQQPIALSCGNGLYFDTMGGSHGDLASYGNYTMLCTTTDQVELTYNANWDIFTEGNKLWEEFSKNGTLNNNSPNNDNTLGSDDRYPAGALCAKITLLPGQSREIAFQLAWHMPHYPDVKGKDISVYYNNFFSSSQETALYAAEQKEYLWKETTAFEKMLSQSSLPSWLQEKLINDRFPIYTCSWFTKDGKFSINEAPAGMMGCLGTMDQRLACNGLYTNFFPTLDKTELSLFARVQGEDGSISHDLGFGEFVDEPRKGSWSDLCSSFILQVYKHYLYTNDRNFLDNMYDHVKRAVAYQISTDNDKNGIPDVGAGHGTTYDTYHWYGTSAFVASLWITELAICEKIAEIMNDEDFSSQCQKMRKNAISQMIEELWNEKHSFGQYYNNYNDRLGDRKSENCFISQLAGEWFANLVDVISGLPEDKTKAALQTIYKRNVDINNIVIMNDETTPEGDFFGYGYTFLQYDEVYYGCLAIYHDYLKEGLKVFEKIYQRTKDMQWNIGLTYYTNGRFCGLPYYMTNPASLFLLDALSGWMPDTANGILKLFPHTSEDLRLPLFSPTIWLMLDYQQTSEGSKYVIHKIKLPKGTSPQFDKLVLRADKKVFHLLVNGKEVKFTQNQNRLTASVTLNFTETDSYNIELLFA